MAPVGVSLWSRKFPEGEGVGCFCVESSTPSPLAHWQGPSTSAEGASQQRGRGGDENQEEGLVSGNDGLIPKLDATSLFIVPVGYRLMFGVDALPFTFRKSKMIELYPPQGRSGARGETN